MNNKRLALVAVMVMVSAGLGACGGASTGASNIDPGNLCRTDDFRLVQSGCEAGQRIVFLPNSWGNEQLPVMFAALNCDHRHQITMTKGAVSCIFRPVKATKEGQ